MELGLAEVEEEGQGRLAMEEDDDVEAWQWRASIVGGRKEIR